ncbi:hypothetical protein [Eubacterium oxidoreducens]|uniref:Uncharacterized protein n=1 Tax=Eubacterium oxidoreducens TaxID=1732 RepID=A0A1G6AX30_EUBOX|nr:hypothetical protein [Eubacterium oxidoreducens]SDB12967.1 hypothetical protein SAMN02910417_00991 [Eubacterium oxidoreducens]
MIKPTAVISMRKDKDNALFKVALTEIPHRFVSKARRLDLEGFAQERFSCLVNMEYFSGFSIITNQEYSYAPKGQLIYCDKNGEEHYLDCLLTTGEQEKVFELCRAAFKGDIVCEAMV